jgi:hypothetical protein
MMDESAKVIISGMLVDNVSNRAFVTRMTGSDSEELWPRPYMGSVQFECNSCGGLVWVGPACQKARLNITASGDDPEILCLVCASLLAHASGADMSVIQLTDKKAGELPTKFFDLQPPMT